MNILIFRLGEKDSFICNEQVKINEEDSEELVQLKERIKSNYFGESEYFEDEQISLHQRFRYLSKNVRDRRERKVRIEQNVFADVHTNLSEKLVGDHMGLGMGLGCLQQTFSTNNIDNCRLIYDQLSIFSPVMLALTAATPSFRARLMQNDTRYNQSRAKPVIDNKSHINHERSESLITSHISMTSEASH